MIFGEDIDKSNTLTRKQAVKMTKQLGLMPLLYEVEKKINSIFTKNRGLHRNFGNKPASEFIFECMRTENKLIEFLDSWDKALRREKEKN